MMCLRPTGPRLYLPLLVLAMALALPPPVSAQFRGRRRLDPLRRTAIFSRYDARTLLTARQCRPPLRMRKKLEIDRRCIIDAAPLPVNSSKKLLELLRNSCDYL